MNGLKSSALLLLAARMGLRPVDIVGLRLGDIDWRQRQITLTQHKTGTVLPLLADVGDAIAGYLLHGRPAGAADEHVFLRTQAPFTALSPVDDLYHVAARAFARTRIPAQGGAGRVSTNGSCAHAVAFGYETRPTTCDDRPSDTGTRRLKPIFGAEN